MQSTGNSEPATAQPGAAQDFEAFVRGNEPRLRHALVAACGFDDGRDATAEALAYAWEHWTELQGVANLPGYLYRVGRTRGRRAKREPALHEAPGWEESRFEPGLPGALASLSERQRLAVILVHGYGYSLREVAELTGLARSSIQIHAARGLARLRANLGVTSGSER